MIFMNNKKNIVILGAGFGGLAAVKELGKLLRDNAAYRIIVVDREMHHTYYPLLYEVASGRMVSSNQEAAERQELTDSARVSYPVIFKNLNQEMVEFARGEAEKIDQEKHEIIFKTGQTLVYDYLLMAIGGTTDFFGIEGLEQHSIPLKSTRDGLRVRAKIEQCIADIKHRDKVSFNVVIGGGGATGVELAAELAHYFWRLIHREGLTSGAYAIYLVEGSPRLLSMCPPKVSQKVLHRLEHLGVGVLLDTCIMFSDATTITMAPRPLRPGETEEMLVCDFRDEKQKKLEYDILVWAGGIRAPEILKTSEFAVDRKGRLQINDYCQVKSNDEVLPRIYAIGDCALLENEQKQVVPALAQSVMAEAKIAASNIFGEIYGLGKQRMKTKFYQTLVPLGGKYAVFVGQKIQLFGLVPWLIREVVNLRYFLKIMPFGRALLYWWRGIDIYSQND